MQETLIVVGAVVIRDGRVLAAQRAEPEADRGRWEFPGGKTEPGESPGDALVRECREELGVTVEVRERIRSDLPLPRPDRRTGLPAVLRLYRVELLEGVPRPLEHLALEWVDIAGLERLDWLPADRPFLGPIAHILQVGEQTA
ncbi:(deoxy)nucleoside triphosphate pyrophosphohydrolase [Nocardiopsis alba]|uniref:(deoxy)nucleoside triphosphate pyrophosphohydrolase n=1 Tax=Nocardiopsis alba TaxID=53437 RepID=UPI00366C03D0